MGFNGIYDGIPSGKRLQFANWKITILFMDKSTISTWPCSIAMLVYQRVLCYSRQGEAPHLYVGLESHQQEIYILHKPNSSTKNVNGGVTLYVFIAPNYIANLRYPAKNHFFCWLVDIPMNTKSLKD